MHYPRPIPPAAPSRPQPPNIIHAWDGGKPPICYERKGDHSNRHLSSLTQEEIVASIHASKERYQKQREQGLKPDGQLVLIRIRPAKSTWMHIRDGIMSMTGALNEGIRRIDFLPVFPFSLGFGMPTGGQRITSTADEPLERALAAVYGKLEAADQYINDLRESISQLRTQIDEARKGPSAPTPTPGPGNTTGAPSADTVTYEQFRLYAESLGFEVKIWNPVSHDVCDTSCNKVTNAWTGPSDTAINIDGLPIVSSRNNPDMTFLLLQAFIRPNDRIVTTDEQFAKNEECLSFVRPEACVEIPRECSEWDVFLPMLASQVRGQIEKNTRTFVDLNDKEQDFVINDLKNPGAGVPHIEVRYLGPAGKPAVKNITSPMPSKVLNNTDDTVTVLDFLRYAEAHGLSSRVSRKPRYFFDCGDRFDVRNTRLNDVPIILSRGDAQASLALMQAFVQPGSLIITTNHDFAQAQPCLGLAREVACIDRSNYCDSSVWVDPDYQKKRRWQNVAQAWAEELARAIQAQPHRRIFFDLSVDEHKALMDEIDLGERHLDGASMNFVLIGKGPDLWKAGGTYRPLSTVPSCSPTPLGHATGTTGQEPGTGQNSPASSELWSILGPLLGLAGAGVIGGGVYCYRKRDAGTPILNQVTVAGKDDRALEMEKYLGDDE